MLSVEIKFAISIQCIFFLQLLHHTLVPGTGDFTTTTVLEGVSYTENEAIILLMYYMTILAEVRNIMYVLLKSVMLNM